MQRSLMPSSREIWGFLRLFNRSLSSRLASRSHASLAMSKGKRKRNRENWRKKLPR
jgi:hypothetical protein